MLAPPRIHQNYFARLPGMPVDKSGYLFHMILLIKNVTANQQVEPAHSAIIMLPVRTKERNVFLTIQGCIESQE